MNNETKYENKPKSEKNERFGVKITFTLYDIVIILYQCSEH